MSRKVLYLVGPTCSGKSTVAESLHQKYGYGVVGSAMTRESRNDKDINLFLDKLTFESFIKEDKFLEHAIYSNEYYGTLKESMLSSFKDDNILSIKVIEVNGLMQILQSGFHESSGIDFFIVYLKPQFPSYESNLRIRKDWEVRVEEDKKLYNIFVNTVHSSVPRKKYSIVNNSDNLDKVISDINMLCLSNDSNQDILRTILQVPDSVELGTKYDGTSSYSLTLIDSNFTMTTRNFYLRSKMNFNALRYMSEVFEKDISYMDSEYLAISLSSHGMLAVVRKDSSISTKDKLHHIL